MMDVFFFRNRFTGKNYVEKLPLGLPGFSARVSWVCVYATPTLGNDKGFNIRGFRSGRNYRNGLVANGGNTNFPAAFDTANLQSIEVLKRPASILFGRIEPGGMVLSPLKDRLQHLITHWSSKPVSMILIARNGIQQAL